VLPILLLSASTVQAQFRPPAVPLITHDPYFSVWSAADALSGDQTRHWTGTVQSLYSALRVDGTLYRLMGREVRGQQGPALQQQSVLVLPTRTIYKFTGAGLAVTLTFLTPALPSDLDVLSRPATYVTWDIASADGRPHDVDAYFDVSSDLAVNTPEQPVTWGRFRMGPYSVLRTGSVEQPLLAKSGDNLRIDWGYLYAVAPHDDVASYAGDRDAVRASFAQNGTLPDRDDFSAHRVAGRRGVSLAFAWQMRGVAGQPVSRHAIVAYDDGFSIEYFNRRLRPWWRRNGAEANDMLADAIKDYDRLTEASKRFDDTLMADLRKAGGDHYAEIAALAFRQAVAAHKLVADLDGTPLLFSKENFSNGCIATVDVTYPSSPFFLLFSPTLLRGMLTPIMDYASLPRWRFPFAPHDLGTYPLANGQVYGGGERTEENQMPVEESGNMLLMVAALAQVEGNASYAQHYWPLLTKWAEYLRDKGFDPENQLSTDDFAGHLAHNANLSIKAILALGAYAKLAAQTGHQTESASYRKLAEGFVKQWTSIASDGGHYRLAFDKPGTWSQKYNLVWDRLLRLNLFPPDIARTEIAFYKTVQGPYGLPLDNRELYTKLDWIIWTASLADTPADFSALVDPVHKFLNESPSRVPMTDWYWTNDGKQRGFQARSVVGGVFIKMLADPEVWKKWAAAALAK